MENALCVQKFLLFKSSEYITLSLMFAVWSGAPCEPKACARIRRPIFHLIRWQVETSRLSAAALA